VRLGVYEVGDELGRGGMGTVYRARSPDGRDVAIKVLAEPGDPDRVAAFERESRLLWTFSEADGFVPVIDTLAEHGKRCIVMPFSGRRSASACERGRSPSRTPWRS